MGLQAGCLVGLQAGGSLVCWAGPLSLVLDAVGLGYWAKSGLAVCKPVGSLVPDHCYGLKVKDMGPSWAPSWA